MLSVLAASYAMISGAHAQPTSCTPTETAPVCVIQDPQNGKVNIRIRWLNNGSYGPDPGCWIYTLYSLKRSLSITNIIASPPEGASGPAILRTPLIPKFGGGDKYKADVYYTLAHSDGSCIDGDKLYHGSAWITFPTAR